MALDGFDGAGKSHLSRELAELAHGRAGRPIVQVSIDGFHQPKANRVAAGIGPEGFYHGSYRYDAFRDCVVEGLRVRGSITPAVWDVARDEPVDASQIDVPPTGIVLVDGVFLQRPELRAMWDAAVWIHAPFEVSVRAVMLDFREAMTLIRRLQPTADMSAVSVYTSPKPDPRNGPRGYWITLFSTVRRCIGITGSRPQRSSDFRPAPRHRAARPIRGDWPIRRRHRAS